MKLILKTKLRYIFWHYQSGFWKKNALLVSTIDNISIHKIFLFKSLFSLRFLLLFQAYITKQVFETWLKNERIASLKLWVKKVIELGKIMFWRDWERLEKTLLTLNWMILQYLIVCLPQGFIQVCIQNMTM